MTKPLTQKEQVAVFVRYQPNCAVGDVSEALDMHACIAKRRKDCLRQAGRA